MLWRPNQWSVNMVESSTDVLASVGLCAAYPQLDLAALGGAFGGAFFFIFSPGTRRAMS